MRVVEKVRKREEKGASEGSMGKGEEGCGE
jgi:hypothetical protein